MNEYFSIGIMSGTSLDGLDIAMCNFKFELGNWRFKIEKAVTIPYNEQWKNKLENAAGLSAYQFVQLHREFGHFIGNQVNEFVNQCKIKPDIIASHGHTVFHEPGKKINFQIGDGASIAAATGITTVSDFRSLDINLGGQGAPLVPIGDYLLFDEYDFCINLGGFANISYLDKQKTRLAYDICPVNIVLNYLASQVGFGFDKDGELGKAGVIDKELLLRLNQIPFYKLKPPKSLGKEWLDNSVIPILEQSSIALHDKMRTFYEHIVIQIINCFRISDNNIHNTKALITGGGALNKFLIEQLITQTDIQIIIPDKEIIEYKEALIFAFLGVLRMQNKVNCLKSVTGAKYDNCGGQIFYIG